jgi:hypothetical protein
MRRIPDQRRKKKTGQGKPGRQLRQPAEEIVKTPMVARAANHHNTPITVAYSES